MRAAVALAAVLAACGDNHPDTRLHATFLVFEDAKLFTGWFDSEQNAACHFAVAGDGQFRCIPNAAQWLEFEYADAACTIPLMRPDELPCDATFAIVPERNAPCTGTTQRHVHALGPAHTGDVYTKGDGCTKGETLDGIREIADEVPPETYVAATLVREDGGDAFAPYAFHADDGSREVTGIWDIASDRECALRESDDRCVPADVAFDGHLLFADDTCSTHAASFHARRLCSDPSAVEDVNDASFLAVGDEVDMEFEQLGGTCQGFALGSERAFAVGAPLADSSFPKLARVQDGTGRVTATRAVDADGRRLQEAFQLFDTEANEPCAAVTFSDGTLRCKPTSAVDATFFADAACTEPVVAFDPAAPPAVAMRSVQASEACGLASYASAHALGDPVTGQVFENFGSCSEGFPDPTFVVARLGDAVELPVLTKE